MKSKDLPKVVITLDSVAECNDDPVGDFVTIDVHDAEGLSAGVIVLDNPADLHLLHAAIENFIQKYNIQPQFPSEYGKE